MSQPKPLKVHAKAFLACLALVAFALGFSWAFPFLFITCTRSDQQVECVVEQRLLGIISFKTTTIPDLKTASLHIDEEKSTSSGVRTTDTSFLVLTDAQGHEEKVMLASYKNLNEGRSNSIVEEISSFLDSDEQEFSTWTASLLGYASILPAALGLLFLSLVSWDFVGTRLKSMRTNSVSETIEEGRNVE